MTNVLRDSSDKLGMQPAIVRNPSNPVHPQIQLISVSVVQYVNELLFNIIDHIQLIKDNDFPGQFVSFIHSMFVFGCKLSAGNPAPSLGVGIASLHYTLNYSRAFRKKLALYIDFVAKL